MGSQWLRRLAHPGPSPRRARRNAAANRLGTVLEVPAGREVCAEGALASQWYLLLSGTVAVTSGGRPAGTLIPGEWFGAADPDASDALLAATATAITCVRVLVLDREEYRALSWARPNGELRIAAPFASDALA